LEWEPAIGEHYLVSSGGLYELAEHEHWASSGVSTQSGADLVDGVVECGGVAGGRGELVSE
jgi:hypothetical protein